MPIGALWSPTQPLVTDPPTRFFVYPELLRLARAIRICWEANPQLHNLSRTQFLFEIDAFDAVMAHPLRATRRAEATVFFLPLLAVASKQLGECKPEHLGRVASRRSRSLSSHAQRLAAMLASTRREVDFAAGPHVLPCTCVMQRSTYGAALFALLSNHSHNLVSLTHARRAPPESASRLHVIAPYHSSPAMHAAAGKRLGCDISSPPASIRVAFAGSPETTRQEATCAPPHVQSNPNPSPLPSPSSSPFTLTHTLALALTLALHPSPIALTLALTLLFRYPPPHPRTGPAEPQPDLGPCLGTSSCRTAGAACAATG